MASDRRGTNIKGKMSPNSGAERAERLRRLRGHGGRPTAGGRRVGNRAGLLLRSV